MVGSRRPKSSVRSAAAVRRDRHRAEQPGSAPAPLTSSAPSPAATPRATTRAPAHRKTTASTCAASSSTAAEDAIVEDIRGAAGTDSDAALSDDDDDDVDEAIQEEIQPTAAGPPALLLPDSTAGGRASDPPSPGMPVKVNSKPKEVAGQRLSIFELLQQNRARTQALQQNLSKMNQTLADEAERVRRKEEEEAARLAEEREANLQELSALQAAMRRTKLLSLCDDALELVFALLDAPTLCALRCTCRYLREFERLEGGPHCAHWRRLCRHQWDEQAAEPAAVACLMENNGLGVQDYYEEEVHSQWRERFGEWWDVKGMHHPPIWDNGIEGARAWRAVYRDRHLGWHTTLRIVHWLHRNLCPTEVAGRKQRYEVHLGCKYAAMLTLSGRAAAARGRRAALRAAGALPVLTAILDVDHAPPHLEAVCATLANLAHHHPPTKAELLALKCDHKLVSVVQRFGGLAGICREAARCLVSLWSPDAEGGSLGLEVRAGPDSADVPEGGPEVALGPGHCAPPPSEPLLPGKWSIAESYFSAETQMYERTMQREVWEVTLECSEEGQVYGVGYDDTRVAALAQFEVVGGRGRSTGAWHLTRMYGEGEASGFTYCGYRDARGLWGLCLPQFSYTSKAPRVFRMWHTQTCTNLNLMRAPAEEAWELPLELLLELHGDSGGLSMEVLQQMAHEGLLQAPAAAPGAAAASSLDILGASRHAAGGRPSVDMRGSWQGHGRGLGWGGISDSVEAFHVGHTREPDLLSLPGAMRLRF